VVLVVLVVQVLHPASQVHLSLTQVVAAVEQETLLVLVAQVVVVQVQSVIQVQLQVQQTLVVVVVVVETTLVQGKMAMVLLAVRVSLLFVIQSVWQLMVLAEQ
jgi:hypothetical protein